MAGLSSESDGMCISSQLGFGQPTYICFVCSSHTSWCHRSSWPQATLFPMVWDSKLEQSRESGGMESRLWYKRTGGLGLKDLGTQNICLLLKLIHKLHLDTNSSWVQWVQENASVASLAGNLHGQHWDMLRSILPIYQAITTVTLADGSTTSFWHDVWEGEDSMCQCFINQTSKFIRLPRCSRKMMVASKRHEDLYWFRPEPYI